MALNFLIHLALHLLGNSEPQLTSRPTSRRPLQDGFSVSCPDPSVSEPHHLSPSSLPALCPTWPLNDFERTLAQVHGGGSCSTIASGRWEGALNNPGLLGAPPPPHVAGSARVCWAGDPEEEPPALGIQLARVPQRGGCSVLSGPHP